MEMSHIVWLTALVSAFVLVFSISILSMWSSLNRLRDLCIRLNNQIAEKAQPKQIEKAILGAQSAQDRIDSALMGLEKYKDQVHGEMQRFYGIMRRNEKAAGFVAGQQNSGKPDSEVPDEVTLSDLRPPAEEKDSKADLRRRAREAGL